MAFLSKGNMGRIRFIWAFIAVSVAALACCTTHADAFGAHKYNVIMHFGVHSYTTSTEGNYTKIYNGERFTPYHKAGRLVLSKNGKGVKLELVKGERLVNAYYDYEVEGANSYFLAKWNGKGVLPFYKDSLIEGYKTPTEITDIYVEALLPRHPPYTEMH